MKLHEIISTNEVSTNSILIEKLLPYKKQLYVYYKDLFCCDPVLMVTMVSNAVQYAKIVPSNEFMESICEYLEVDYIDEEDTENDNFSAYEEINFNSRMLKDLL